MAKYVKPTLDTKFHIDFAWWQGRNLRAHLESHVCAACKDAVRDSNPEETFDWINPETGQVFQVDMLWHIIRSHCSHQPDFVDERTPLTTAIFRTFLANDNTPLSPVEMQERLQRRTPELILRTIGGHRVYEGIRPVTVPV